MPADISVAGGIILITLIIPIILKKKSLLPSFAPRKSVQAPSAVGLRLLLSLLSSLANFSCVLGTENG